MTKLLFVLVVLAIALSYVAIRYRRGIIAAIKIYKALRSGYRRAEKSETTPPRTSIEMKLCGSCTRWFQSEGGSLCNECIEKMKSV